MQNREKQQPRQTEGGERRAEERQDRLAKALRDNLGRRKEQQRARTGDSPQDAKTLGSARRSD